MKISPLIFLFFTSYLFSQESIDSIVIRKTNELESSGIKNYFYFETYCVGSIRIHKPFEIDCSIDDSKIYVFWRNKNDNFVQQLSDCKTSKVEIPNEILDFYLVNKSRIQTQKVEKYKIRKDSIANGKKYSFVKDVSHSCFSRFHFYNSQLYLKNVIDEFDLTNEDNEPNINYQSNNKLKIVELAKLCENILKQKNIN